MTTKAENIYKKYIKHLPLKEKLHLLAITANNLVPEKENHPKSRSLLELDGLGAEIWRDMDAQDYIKKIRNEWDNRS